MEPEVIEIDNRMEWNMRKQDIIGVTAGMDFKPTICYSDHTILPRDMEIMFNEEFYKYSEDGWPTCPYTKQKLPQAD